MKTVCIEWFLDLSCCIPKRSFAQRSLPVLSSHRHALAISLPNPLGSLFDVLRFLALVVLNFIFTTIDLEWSDLLRLKLPNVNWLQCKVEALAIASYNKFQVRSLKLYKRKIVTNTREFPSKRGSWLILLDLEIIRYFKWSILLLILFENHQQYFGTSSFWNPISKYEKYVSYLKKENKQICYYYTVKTTENFSNMNRHIK